MGPDGRALKQKVALTQTLTVGDPGDPIPKKILIVEDDEQNVAVLVNVLELMLGQEEILVAPDGHEGIRMAAEYAPEVILMDLSLPKLNGWEVTRLWLWLLGSAMYVLIGVQPMLFWMLLQVLDAIDARDDQIGAELTRAARAARAMPVAQPALGGTRPR